MHHFDMPADVLGVVYAGLVIVGGVIGFLKAGMKIFLDFVIIHYS